MAQHNQQQRGGNYSRPFSFQIPTDDPMASAAPPRTLDQIPSASSTPRPIQPPSASSTPRPQLPTSTSSTPRPQLPTSTSSTPRAIQPLSASSTPQPPPPTQIDVPVREWAGYPEQRFSYVETPIEDNTQTFDDDEQRDIIAEAQRRYGGDNGMPAPQRASRSGSSLPQARSGQQAVMQGQAYPQDKQTPERMPSAYSQPPPTQPHPAMSAPYADTFQPPPSRTTTPRRSPPTPHGSPPTPHSPGPVPYKDPTTISPQNRTSTAKPPQTFSAPAVPYSPYTAQPPDLRTAHRPGQIMHPSMTRVSTANKTANGASYSTPQPDTSNDFHNSLCACPPSDLSTCLLGLICPCILHGRLAYRLSQRSRKADPTDLLGYSACNGGCVGFAALCPCGLCGVLAAVVRGRVRRAYGVKGGTGEDCVEGCCCFCCVLAQGDREVRAREEGARRWGGPGPGGVAMEEYGRVEGMRYPGAGGGGT